LGGRKGIQPEKNSGGVLVWLSVWSKVQTVSCFSKIHIGFAFLVPAHSEKGLLNVCVCVGVLGLV